MDQQPSQAQVQGRSGRKNFLEERSVDSAGVHLGWEIVWKPQRTEPGTKCLALRGRRLGPSARAELDQARLSWL